MSAFSFKIIKNYNNARLGELKTPHGTINTPAFIFCATKANIKGTTIDHIKDAGSQIILSNTYHLMLQPGCNIIKNAGGIQKFTGWNGPMLTDSGGFQIFSLGHGGVASEIKGIMNGGFKTKTMLKITEDGASFRSYIDGKKILITPEISIQNQIDIGADLIVAFDECTPFHVSKEYTESSMKRSKNWGLRSLNYFNQKGNNENQKLLAVIQGGVYKDLRKESADFANIHEDFFGFAIGGSLGKTESEMRDIVSMTNEMLDKSRPVHLLGIGSIDDIFHGVMCGIDTFDCVSPTRIARHGIALVRKRNHRLNLFNSIFKNDHAPIRKDCDCYTCKNFTKSYIHHLLKTKETLSGTLITIHNVYTMNSLMKDIRKGLENNNLLDIYKDWCD